jgi:pimeloyl-ACP methyl ester carboxylesterase
MARALLDGGIELEYETFGSPDDPVLLLVMGLGAQMIVWDERFCRQLADGGRHVVRFDNRDIGLSTKFDGQHVDVMSLVLATFAKAPIPTVPYDLADMAADAIGLLDHLGVERAHVVGASMGGMIAQTMAIEHAHRLLSVTSMMSTVGDVAYGTPSPEALTVLLTPSPTTREQAIAQAAAYAVTCSKRYFDLDWAQRLAADSFERCSYPEGVMRHIAAVCAGGDRSDALRRVSVPVLVIHGLDDVLINPSGGRRTAELIPGATLLEVADMGHDMPEPLWPTLISAILSHSDAAAAGFDVIEATS